MGSYERLPGLSNPSVEHQLALALHKAENVALRLKLCMNWKGESTVSLELRNVVRRDLWLSLLDGRVMENVE